MDAPDESVPHSAALGQEFWPEFKLTSLPEPEHVDVKIELLEPQLELTEAKSHDDDDDRKHQVSSDKTRCQFCLQLLSELGDEGPAVISREKVEFVLDSKKWVGSSKNLDCCPRCKQMFEMFHVFQMSCLAALAQSWSLLTEKKVVRKEEPVCGAHDGASMKRKRGRPRKKSGIQKKSKCVCVTEKSVSNVVGDDEPASGIPFKRKRGRSRKNPELQVKTEVGQREKHLCSICAAVYGSQSALRLHMTRHGEPKFLCNVCGRGFYRKDKLIKHIAVHSDARNFECKICGKRFKSHEANRLHQRVHTRGATVRLPHLQPDIQM